MVVLFFIPKNETFQREVLTLNDCEDFGHSDIETTQMWKVDLWQGSMINFSNYIKTIEYSYQVGNFKT